MAVMRPDFCTDVPAPAREGPLMVRLRVPEEALRWGVLAGVALLLLTPFVVTSETFFPFVVGKALWSRSLIEIVFMLWAVLALKPEYRPPRSRLLILLAAGLGVSLLAACFGVSFQRSMWSEYERMQGVVDLAHWFALAVVLASVLRSGREWRALLCLNLGAGAAMACLVIARYHQWDVPFYGDLQEQHLPRMSGPLGNPIYLSAYLLFNLVVALGFMARSCLPAAAAPAAQARKPRDRRRRPAKRRALQDPRWMRLLWAIVVALHSWGLVLAGSVGGFAGLFASLGFVAVAYAFLARGPWRRIAVIALGVAAVLLGISFLDPGRMATPWLDRPVPWKVAKLDFQRPSVQARLAAWETGVKGFTERPVLGWGPGNFATVFGRFASGYATTVKPHDQAHGKLIEVASTTGALGLAAYLALWSWTFLAVRQAARGMDRGDRALALFAGAALAGHFVQSQSLFDTATNSLQYTLLFAFVVWLERPAFESGGGGGGGGGGDVSAGPRGAGRRGARGADPGGRRPGHERHHLPRGPRAVPGRGIGTVHVPPGTGYRRLRAARGQAEEDPVREPGPELEAVSQDSSGRSPAAARVGGCPSRGGARRRARELDHRTRAGADVPRGGVHRARVRRAGATPARARA